MNSDIVVIGGGPAGLAAAISAKKNGCDSVTIIERDFALGGVLNQCIHNGFGLHMFKEELTGPEYAKRYVDEAKELGIEIFLDTMAANISKDKVVTVMDGKDGMFDIQAKAIILAMGCRERSRGAINIPGYRPAGIFSAGTAQRLVNMEGQMPGKNVVILGSGDIGLIMARRMTLEGANVKVVAEILPYSGGLKRNIVQCLDDFGIPLKLSHTVVDIKGRDHIESVTIAEVDEKMEPIPGTEEEFECDTLLLSVGLIPENELSRTMGVDISNVTLGPMVNESLETNVEGVFACGNVLHVHDLVDYVSEEAALAGRNAARYVRGETKKSTPIPVVPKDGVRYTVPATIDPISSDDEISIKFRVGTIFKNKFVSAYVGDKRVHHNKHRILAPGEMEQVILLKKDITKDTKEITIKLED